MKSPADDAGAWDAGLYESKHSFVWKHGTAALEWLNPQPGERILDVGCGTGHLTSQIAAAGADVVGIDSSARMIEHARTAYPHLRFEQADARTFSFDEPFDAIFSNAALHWVHEADVAAGRIAAALKPGGRFVAEFGGQGNVRAIESALRRVHVAWVLSPAAPLWYFPSIAAYASVLERAGLETISAILFDRPTPLEGEHGLRDWIVMFAGEMLARVPGERQAAFFEAVEADLRPTLYSGGRWSADYRRLRISARRPA